MSNSMAASITGFSAGLSAVTDCRGLVHLFSCRCLQMWSADCRRFTSEKTNNTLIM
ncbi:hypothetical protein Hanom_Chr12g01075281 [Helianthus anomalus]